MSRTVTRRASRVRRSALASPPYFHVLLILWCAVSVFPLLWMVGTSLKPTSEGIGGIGSMITLSPTAENYARVAALLPLARNTLNSFIVASAGTVATVLLCSLAGFAFAKYDFPGRDFLFLFLLATMLVPPEVGIVPTFLIMKKLRWINTYWALVVPRAATAIGIFYMRQYITGFPGEILEQGRLDGCRELRIYWQLVLPVVSPALAAWSTIAFIARWNDFMWPLIIMTDNVKYTLPVALANLRGEHLLDVELMMAGSVVTILPVVILFLAFQRHYIRGILVGGVKG